MGPTGVDKGAGGKYLVLPPGYDKPVPHGYIVFHSDVYQGYGLLRSILKDGQDAVAAAVEYGKRIRLYPLNSAGNPPESVLIDSAGRMFDATIPYNITFFESLDRMVQSQPWIERDRMAINTLRSLGIEKGKSFSLAAGMKEILTAALQEPVLSSTTAMKAIHPFTRAGTGSCLMIRSFRRCSAVATRTVILIRSMAALFSITPPSAV